MLQPSVFLQRLARMEATGVRHMRATDPEGLHDLQRQQDADIAKQLERAVEAHGVTGQRLFSLWF